MAPEMHDDLFRTLDEKGRLKQLVYRNTLESLRLIREATADMGREYREQYGSDPTAIPFHFQDEGEFETRLQFAGDVLVFLMHTNVFEFSRYHEVMTTSYIREDKDRSYCGIISIYNFLSDSFKYNRVNDLGYLIGRIFVNKDRCYFIEGKREVGLLYNNFGKEVMDKARARKIVESAMLYAIRFDLLTPPYDALKEITLGEIRSMVDGTTLKTGKRLGFRFQADSTDDRID
jgi:hypothetical protein